MIELMCALRTNVADYPAINDIFFLKNADHPAITDILWPNADNPAIIWCIVSPHLYANIAVGKNPAHVVDKVWKKRIALPSLTFSKKRNLAFCLFFMRITLP